MIEELKPCPFCGEPIVRMQELAYSDSDATFFVGCNKCGGTGGEYAEKASAVDAWNKRICEPEADSMPEYAIWWLSEEDCETIAVCVPTRLPEYIRSEFSSRYGRNGRGRLWEARGMNTGIAVDPWPNTPLAKEIERYSYGGIIIRDEDVPLVACLPGLVTDASLNYWVGSTKAQKERA